MVAKQVERRERKNDIKPGVIYWCNFGVGIGSEMLGKGSGFTRPVLVLAKIDTRLLLVLPVTSQEKSGPHYAKICINGRLEDLALYQMMTIDSLRIVGFIDELSPDTFREVKKSFLKLLKRELYKENNPNNQVRVISKV